MLTAAAPIALLVAALVGPLVREYADLRRDWGVSRLGAARRSRRRSFRRVGFGLAISLPLQGTPAVRWLVAVAVTIATYSLALAALRPSEARAAILVSVSSAETAPSRRIFGSSPGQVDDRGRRPRQRARVDDRGDRRAELLRDLVRVARIRRAVEVRARRRDGADLLDHGPRLGRKVGHADADRVRPLARRARRSAWPGCGSTSVNGPGSSDRAATAERPRSSGMQSRIASRSAASSAIGIPSSRPLSRASLRAGAARKASAQSP